MITKEITTSFTNYNFNKDLPKKNKQAQKKWKHKYFI